MNNLDQVGDLAEYHDDPLSIGFDAKRGGWAILEVMGHRRHEGFVSEITMFGVQMVQVIVPAQDGAGVAARHVYAGTAIFSVTPVPKAIVLGNRQRSLALCERNEPNEDDEMPW